MDINDVLKNVNNLSAYISVTQDFSNKCKNAKIQINITTVLSLKKIRSYEIEYFIKCEENGLACEILERILCLPASKTWGVLGKELVNLLQYWLDAVRKHLISHSLHWWTFLKLLLRFVMEIRLKDTTIPNVLVEQTAECLLDLAANEHPDAFQKHEILYCLNMFCAESNREIRFALRNKFSEYFLKLSTYMASCGHLPCQYSIIETLLRWLLPRQDRTLRLTAAAKWFPQRLYGTRAVDIFLERSWHNFFHFRLRLLSEHMGSSIFDIYIAQSTKDLVRVQFTQDARDFLNALNDASDLVTSFVCRKLSVGNIVIKTGREQQEMWLDVNRTGRCVSVVLEPAALAGCGGSAGGAGPRACEALLVTEESTRSARLHRRQQEIIISLSTLHPPQVHPSGNKISDDDIRDVTVVVSSRTDMRSLDEALRRTFGDKYQLLLDVDAEFPLSPLRPFNLKNNGNNSEEDTRFSHPVEVRRRGHSGYIVKPRNIGSCKSPSTASTSSLAQLHEKLASLPRYKYEKETVAVCAMPELSVVTEQSESEERQSFNTSTSTLKLNRYGVCHRNIKIHVENTSRKSRSDCENAKPKVKLGRCLSPVVNDEHSTSLLHVATVGSADESIIDDTLERNSKAKEVIGPSLVDLLVNEALQTKLIAVEKEKLLDSGINTGENKNTQYIPEKNSEEIEDTPYEEINKKSRITKVKNDKTCTIISKSTSGDESNTEVVYETPINHINLRKKNLDKKKQSKPQIEIFEYIQDKPLNMINEQFNTQEVEDFFTQHLAETKAGEIAISPSLAKKINNTSSESSQNFDEQNGLMGEDNIGPKKFENIDIIECLNSLLDKVCNDLDKCTEYLNKDKERLECQYNKTGTADNIDRLNKVIPIENIEPKPKENIKSKQTKKEKAKLRVTKKRKNKLDIESKSKMSTIIEVNDELIVEENNNKEISPTDTKTPENTKRETRKSTETTTRRKRKLYSPKDDQLQNAKQSTYIVDTDEEDTLLSKLKTYKRLRKPKSSATCYKEIEEERQKHIRLPRTRKSNALIAESPSPRTAKMNAVFDKLKDTVNSSEKNNLAKRISTEGNVYNFTSDSEDEDFKKKKIELQKHISSTTVNSLDSVMTMRYGRVINRGNSDDKSLNIERNKKNRRNKVDKRQTNKRKVNVKINTQEPLIDLVDERMRGTIPEVLNTSFVAEISGNKSAEPKLVLKKRPQMETVDDYVNEESTDALPSRRKNVGRKNKKTEVSLSLKKEKGSSRKEVLTTLPRNDDDGTESPLPGLVVESVTTHKDEGNDSVTVNMLKKCKKYYKEGPYVRNDSINTQNMLSDVEKTNFSPRKEHNLCLNEEIYCVNDSNTNIKVCQIRESKQKSHKIKTLKSICKGNNSPQSVKVSNVNDMNEIVNITEFGDLKSEKSIATVGITGHGDFDESPPNLRTIKQTLPPRGLGLEDLDQSMKDYFVKLTREINNSEDIFPQECIQSNDTADKCVYDKINVKDKSHNDASPDVSVKRFPLDDISRWLPSRRNSDSDQSSQTAVNSIQKENRKRYAESCGKEKSPVCVARLSIEEFDKWLPMPDKLGCKENFEEVKSQKDLSKSSLKLVYKKDNNKSPNNNNSSLCDPSNMKNTSKNVIGDATPNRNTFGLKLVFPEKESKGDKSFDRNSIIDDSVKKAKAKLTVISPIKSFHDLNTQYFEPVQSQDEDFIERIRKRFSHKDTKEHKRTHSIENSSTNHIESPVIERKKRNESDDSPKSTSTRIEDPIARAVKRIPSPIQTESKKMKSDLNKSLAVTIAESGPSVSSVNDWFKTIESSLSRTEGLTLPFRDSIQTVMEKLDTTLVEINQNTSKEFVNLFVDAHKYLAERKQRRRQIYKEVASDILSDIVKMMDEKFADLDKRSQDLETDFMEQLKERAFKLISEDCKQKRAMVLLLKEDVQAVMDHVDRVGETKSE